MRKKAVCHRRLSLTDAAVQDETTDERRAFVAPDEYYCNHRRRSGS
ncbi:MAG: hypothetical protein ACOX0A_08515 [Thermoguttaceae bacterium]